MDPTRKVRGDYSVKFLKIGTPKVVIMMIVLKMEQFGLIDGMVNSFHPDQTALLGTD